ncbi:hypothetical protein ACYSNU_18800 [Enterococcus sp. LJL120]
MTIFLMAISIIINYLILFKIPVVGKYIFLPPAIIIPITFLVAAIMNIFQVVWTEDMRNTGISIIMTSGVFTIMCFAKAVIPFMFDIVIGFHKKYNQKNLHRFPISFFIKYQTQIIRVEYIIFFLGGIVMLYGVYIGGFQ